MLVYILLAIAILQGLKLSTLKKIEIKPIMTYLLPYWERGDSEDRILGLLQCFFITSISLVKASQTDHIREGILVFIFTFISFVWFVKLIITLAGWLREYIRLITPNIIFTLLVPLLIFFNSHQIQGRLEVQICLVALLMSLCIVYIELISMILGKQHTSAYLRKRNNLRYKSIFTWLGIVLVNLYTLIVFIQFYWQENTYHFIEATTLNRQAAIDLFYYLVITFTTVGLGDIQPHTEAAKLVTILIALSGMFFTGIFVGVIISTDEHK